VRVFVSDTELDAALSPSRFVGWRSVLYAAGAVCSVWQFVAM